MHIDIGQLPSPGCQSEGFRNYTITIQRDHRNEDRYNQDPRCQAAA